MVSGPIMYKTMMLNEDSEKWLTGLLVQEVLDIDNMNNIENMENMKNMSNMDNMVFRGGSSGWWMSCKYSYGHSQGHDGEPYVAVLIDEFLSAFSWFPLDIDLQS